MDDVLLRALLSNTLIAGGLSLAGWIVWRFTGLAPLARGLWLLALLRLVVPPVLEVATSWLPRWDDEPAAASAALPAPGAMPVFESSELDEASLQPEPVAAPAPGAARRVADGVFALWWMGVILAVVVGTARVRRCRLLVQCARPASDDLVATVRRLASKLGLARVPDVREVDANLSPFLWAFGPRPTVVLPTRMMAALGAMEREAVLAHELAHLARRDHLVRWLELVVLTVHWWNPIARWTCRRLTEVEELCCDARAVQALASTPRGYGRAILMATEFLASRNRQAVPYGATGLGGARLLRRRIMMIVNKRLEHRLGWRSRLGMAMLTFALLPFGLQAQECPKCGAELPAKEAGKHRVRVVVEEGEGAPFVLEADQLTISGKGHLTTLPRGSSRVLELDDGVLRGTGALLARPTVVGGDHLRVRVEGASDASPADRGAVELRAVDGDGTVIYLRQLPQEKKAKDTAKNEDGSKARKKFRDATRRYRLVHDAGTVILLTEDGSKTVRRGTLLAVPEGRFRRITRDGNRAVRGVVLDADGRVVEGATLDLKPPTARLLPPREGAARSKTRVRRLDGTSDEAPLAELKAEIDALKKKLKAIERRMR